MSNYEDYAAIGFDPDYEDDVNRADTARWPQPEPESPFTVWVTVPWRDHTRMYQMQARQGHRANLYAEAVAEYLVNHGDVDWFATVWPGATSEDHGSAPMYPTRSTEEE